MPYLRMSFLHRKISDKLPFLYFTTPLNPKCISQKGDEDSHHYVYHNCEFTGPFDDVISQRSTTIVR